MFFVLAAVGLLMFFVGRLQNKFGIKTLVTIGALLCGADVFVLLVADNIFWIYLWAFIKWSGVMFRIAPNVNLGSEVVSHKTRFGFWNS